jgi:hypothetical protein
MLRLISLSGIPRDILVSLLILKHLEIGWDFLWFIWRIGEEIT